MSKTWYFRDDPCSMQVYLLLLMSPLKQFFRPVSVKEAEKHFLYGCKSWSDLCEHATQWAHDNADAEGATTLQSARTEAIYWLYTCLKIKPGVLFALPNT